MAYYRATCDFFSWCDRHRIGGIADIEPLHVAAYIENLGRWLSFTVRMVWAGGASRRPASRSRA